MKKYDHVIIGFGKGGKTLANIFASKGNKVAIIEQSQDMFGGTCINVACIPSKFLENNARLSNKINKSFDEKAEFYTQTIKNKRELTKKLREKNYTKAVSSGVEVIVGKASFLSSNELLVVDENGVKTEVLADKIYINTGAKAFIPEIDGLKESKFVFTSESLMEEEKLPKELIIIGAGYIGLEFASYYSNFGSKVTIVQTGESFMPREDKEISLSALESFKNKGINFINNVDILSIKDYEEDAGVIIKNKEDEKIIEVKANAVLVATGRRPNVEGLNIDKAGVKLTKRGAIEVDESLKTSINNIWALGDVIGKEQFTYISLDDSRIIKSAILGNKDYDLSKRKNVPYSVFIDPPLSRVGLTEQEALEKGYEIKVARLPAQAIPKAQVLENPVGMLKAIIDVKTDQILGVHLFCQESYEMINLIKLAMDNNLPYYAIRDMIFTHPTMSEALNDLFSSLK